MRSIVDKFSAYGYSPMQRSYVHADCAGTAFWPIRDAKARASELKIAVIDGPYDANALSSVLARAPIQLGSGRCSNDRTGTCNHGTFIVGLLGARRDAPIPGLCPDCQLLHFPLFSDEAVHGASVEELSRAIVAAATAGARLINLSLSVVGEDLQSSPSLGAALNLAEARGAVVVAAVGEKDFTKTGQLLSHPVTIPVVALDVGQRRGQTSYVGSEIVRRGLAALGLNVLGYAAGGGTIAMSGTSVATGIVTGILAEAWLANPAVNGEEIRQLIARLGAREGSRPPMLDRDALHELINRRDSDTNQDISRATESCGTNSSSLRGETRMTETIGQPTLIARSSSAAAQSAKSSPVAYAPSGCACSKPGGVCTCQESEQSGFVYAIGTIEAEYPNVSIEREMQVLAYSMGVEAVAPVALSMKPTEDRRWQHAVLSGDKKRTRYLARQLSWRLTIEDCSAFVIRPRDSSDLDDLIDCLGRSKYSRSDDNGSPKKGGRRAATVVDDPFETPQDLDVIVGVAGSQTSDGTEVFLDQAFTIEPRQLAPPGLGTYVQQLADNFGLTDQDRGYNYLLARYTLSPENIEEIGKEFELSAVPAIKSRLSDGGRRIVRVIYTFSGTGPNVQAEKRYFIRVDVTDEFPFVITPWHPYLKRGEDL